MKITIVGPRSSGKTTISRLLAKRLGLKHVEVDRLIDEKMKEYGGLDKAIKSSHTETIMKKGPEVVRKGLDQEDIVFDLSGGSISARRGFQLGVCQQVIEFIRTQTLIVALLPTIDADESVALLFKREVQREHFKEMNKEKLKNKVRKDFLKLKPVIDTIAERIVYVKDKTPEAIVEEINEFAKK
ncbi:MAG: shikimate kinase [Nanobdellota archaeon]